MNRHGGSRKGAKAAKNGTYESERVPEEESRGRISKPGTGDSGLGTGKGTREAKAKAAHAKPQGRKGMGEETEALALPSSCLSGFAAWREIVVSLSRRLTPRPKGRSDKHLRVRRAECGGANGAAGGKPQAPGPDHPRGRRFFAQVPGLPAGRQPSPPLRQVADAPEPPWRRRGLGGRGRLRRAAPWTGVFPLANPLRTLRIVVSAASGARADRGRGENSIVSPDFCPPISDFPSFSRWW
jgi:hypothetical protein